MIRTVKRLNSSPTSHGIKSCAPRQQRIESSSARRRPSRVKRAPPKRSMQQRESS